MKRVLTVLMLLVSLVFAGAESKCGPDVPTSDGGAIPKPTHTLSFEFDWPEGRHTPVTVHVIVQGPDKIPGTNRYPILFDRLFHQVSPPLIVDFTGYTGGYARATGIQQEPGHFACHAYIDHREVGRPSWTDHKDELISCVVARMTDLN